MDIDALPQPPIVTAEALAEFDADQLRRASTHPAIFGGDIFLQRAYAVIHELSSLKDSLTIHQMNDLADAYASAGMFDEAAKLNTDKSDEFTAINAALSEKQRCGCPDIHTVQLIRGTSRELIVSPVHVTRNIYSNGEWISLYKCNNCGHLST